MTNITKKMTALAAAAFLTLTLAACGNSEPEDAPTLGAPTVSTENTDNTPTSEETPTEETPTEAPTEAPEFDPDDITVGTWAELDAYKAPEGADDIWGDEEASQGIKDAMDALFMLYIDGDAGGIGIDGEKRSVQDYAQLHDVVTDTLSDTMKPIIKKAVKGDEGAGNTVGLFFPQSPYGENLEIDGKTVLDEIDVGMNDVTVEHATAQVLDSDGEYYLNVTVRHDITYDGSFEGDDKQVVITQDTRLSMLPTGDGSWKIDGIGVEVVDFK